MRLKRFVYQDLSDKEFLGLCTDRHSHSLNVEDKRPLVQEILHQVRDNGDQALRFYTQKWDGIDLSTFWMGREELSQIALTIVDSEKEAIHLAYSNIFKFHEEQKPILRKTETMPGVVCWKEPRPIGKVGLYIPGGSAPLFSTFLMLGIPSILAGVPRLVVCTPAQKTGSRVHPALAYIAGLLGIQGIYTVGGAQAIAAMGYGTESIPKVDKIFGPGNAYVTLAKQIIMTETQTSIDMPAGPSEVLVIGNETSNPHFIASDLLAQAEHGPDSQAVLVSTSGELMNQVEACLEQQLKKLPRAEIIERALAQSFCVEVENLKQAILFSNAYAPEHLILSIETYKPYIELITTAGSVFLGGYSPESAGDYASGTNHTLPTSGYARMYSGVSVDSFTKMISFQSISPSGLSLLGPSVQILASMEGLEAHAASISIRLPTPTLNS